MVETFFQKLSNAIPGNLTIITLPCNRYSPNSLKNDQNNTQNNTFEVNSSSKINRNDITNRKKNKEQKCYKQILKEKSNNIHEEYHLTDENRIDDYDKSEDNSNEEEADENDKSSQKNYDNTEEEEEEEYADDNDNPNEEEANDNDNQKEENNDEYEEDINLSDISDHNEVHSQNNYKAHSNNIINTAQRNATNLRNSINRSQKVHKAKSENNNRHINKVIKDQSINSNPRKVFSQNNSKHHSENKDVQSENNNSQEILFSDDENQQKSQYKEKIYKSDIQNNSQQQKLSNKCNSHKNNKNDKSMNKHNAKSRLPTNFISDESLNNTNYSENTNSRSQKKRTSNTENNEKSTSNNNTQKVNDRSNINEGNLHLSHSQKISSSQSDLASSKSRNNLHSCSQQMQLRFRSTSAKIAKILKNSKTDDDYSDYESSNDEYEQNDNFDLCPNDSSEISNKNEAHLIFSSNSNKKVIYKKYDDVHFIGTQNQDYQSTDSEKCEEQISSKSNKEVIHKKYDDVHFIGTKSQGYQSTDSEKCEEQISSKSNKEVIHKKYGDIGLSITKLQDYQLIDSNKSEEIMSSSSNKKAVLQKFEKNISISLQKQNYQYQFISEKCEELIPSSNDDQLVVIKSQNEQSNYSAKCEEFTSSNKNEQTIFYTVDDHRSEINFSGYETNEYNNYSSDIEQPFTNQENKDDDNEQNFNPNHEDFENKAHNTVEYSSQQKHHIKHFKGNKKHICQKNDESQSESDSSSNDHENEDQNDTAFFEKVRNNLYDHFVEFKNKNTEINEFIIEEEIRSSCYSIENDANINLSQILSEYCENEDHVIDRNELFDHEKLKSNQEFFSIKFKKSTDQIINEIKNKKIFPDVKCIVGVIFSSIGIKSLNAFFDNKIEVLFSSSFKNLSFYIDVDEDSIKNLKSKISDELYDN